MTQRKATTLLSAFLLVGVLLAVPLTASAHSYNRNSTDSHIIRLVTYVVHPIGILLEYGVTRPVHWVVSQPHLDIICGHEPRLDDTYFEWVTGDGQPTISKQREQSEQAKAAPEEPAMAPPPSEVQQPEQAPPPLVIELQEQPQQQAPPAEEKPAPAPQ